jgi:hypothetical protein
MQAATAFPVEFPQARRPAATARRDPTAMAQCGTGTNNAAGTAVSRRSIGPGSDGLIFFGGDITAGAAQSTLADIKINRLILTVAKGRNQYHKETSACGALTAHGIEECARK